MTDSPAPRTDRPNRWLGPLIFLVVVAALILVFMLSNTTRTEVGFAGFHWVDVPVWLLIVIAMVAGAIGSRALGWVWRSWRRRRRRLAEELDTLRKHAADPGG
jgi:uncharacterized integral membrane protein